MAFKRTVYNLTKISAIKAELSSEFLWTAFTQNDIGECLIQKVWANSPDQIFFDIARLVNSIPALDLDATKLYVAYDDSTYLGEIFTLTNPLISTIHISIPSGIIETPVDVKVHSTHLYFLLPGNISGTHAKILHYTTSGTFLEIIDLTKSGLTITNASKMTVDENNEIQVDTYTSPAQIVRVFPVSGGWDFSEITII